MKTKTFDVRNYGNEDSGAYVQLFERSGKQLADINFFEGNRSKKEIEAFVATLNAVLAQME